jgi:hypothetical protein
LYFSPVIFFFIESGKAFIALSKNAVLDCLCGSVILTAEHRQIMLKSALENLQGAINFFSRSSQDGATQTKERFLGIRQLPD